MGTNSSGCTEWERDFDPQTEQPPKTDRLHNLIIGVMNEGFERDRAIADKVREEIKQRGTYWAGDEIATLRRRIESFKAENAALRRQLDARDEGK